MGQALYRKYRSKNLSEIVGQEHITTALDNALKKGQISHAYLFTGPRGVGKTSIARILAHELNGLPYDETATHLDIIEIDAASNRRIDEIRELRERVHNAPANAKYKVYIIDEVHMLTREAFNALLKTLEEPPDHAIFILATTEAHKLPETIISRTQRYSFRPIEPSQATEHLRSIAKKEKISITDEALKLIAEHGDGSFRDSIGLLDQIRNQADKITLETVQEALGIAPATSIFKLVEALDALNIEVVVDELKAMEHQGYHAALVAKQLSEALRSRLLANNWKSGAAALSRLLRELLTVPTAHDSTRLLEIILLESVLAQPSVQKLPPTQPSTATLSPHTPKTDKKYLEPAAEPAKKTPKAAKQQSRPAASELNEESWNLILQAIKARHNTLYSVTRMAVPTFNNQELVLAFSFPFHQKRLNEAKNRQVISDIIKQTTGKEVTITCIVDINARTRAVAASQPPEASQSIEAISNIFGSAEMVE